MAEDRGQLTPPKGRPPVLFPLFAGIDTLPGVGPRMAQGFEGLDVTRPRDLLFLLPQNGLQRRRIERLADARPGEIVTIAVEVTRHHPPTARGRPWRVTCSDGVQDLTLVFFHPRRDWLEAQLPVGQRRVLSGKFELYDGRAQIVHPDHILREDEAPPPDFEAIYPLSGSLTQRAVSRAVEGALARAPELAEWADPNMIEREGFPSWQEALTAAHAPQDRAALALTDPARMRLAYDELLAHQLTLALLRRERLHRKGVATKGDGRLRARALKALPWGLTGAQSRAVEEIATDMAASQRMNRLLQGDVGAGKTLVAWLALLIAVEAGGQGVLMAPTEILARQHGAALIPWGDAAGVRVAVLTGRDGSAARNQILADLEAGLIDVLVGTHAVFQDAVRFADLRLAVIDEQHRFGVAQRMALGRKGDTPPDMLVMTATPIPRSLALAQYGDMELSVLDEKPPGRQPITTTILPDTRREDVEARLGDLLARGGRAYWVCPLVEESEVSDLAAAEERFRTLRARFGDKVRLVHGQMPPEARDEAMADFIAGRAQLLVATTVIEVGVDVPRPPSW